MKRSELEHILRAAGAITDDREIVVIGSQSILGQFPDAPIALLASMEADVFPRTDPQRSELIDGGIREGSPFHQLFGYDAQGVDDRTATLPKGWQERLVRLHNENTGGVTGLCLEVHDLAISKLCRGQAQGSRVHTRARTKRPHSPQNARKAAQLDDGARERLGNRRRADQAGLFCRQAERSERLALRLQRDPAFGLLWRSVRPA